MNWTGHLVTAPRSDLGSLLKRSEPARTGVYILIGDDPAAVAGTRAYIGEGDDVGKRLAQHARPEEQGGKDFWDQVVIITSKDANLTKAHAGIWRVAHFTGGPSGAGHSDQQDSTRAAASAGGGYIGH